MQMWYQDEQKAVEPKTQSKQNIYIYIYVWGSVDEAEERERLLSGKIIWDQTHCKPQNAIPYSKQIEFRPVISQVLEDLTCGKF